MEPVKLMEALNAIYTHFDELVASRPGLWKVETIGDAYIVVGGLFDDVGDDEAVGSSHVVTLNQTANTEPPQARVRAHLEQVLGLAHQLQAALDSLRNSLGLDVHMRIGVHCGDVVTGIVGSQRPRFSKLLHHCAFVFFLNIIEFFSAPLFRCSWIGIDDR